MELSSVFHTFIKQLEEMFLNCFRMLILGNFPQKGQIERNSADICAPNRNRFARFGVFPLGKISSARFNPTSLLELTICSLRDFQSLHRADCFEVVLISAPTVLHSSHLVDTPSNICWLGTVSSYINEFLLLKT